MQANTIFALAQFIARHHVAWATFEKRAQGITFNGFSFVQDRGSWVLTDNDGQEHAFREYNSEIVAITSYTASYVRVEQQFICL